MINQGKRDYDRGANAKKSESGLVSCGNDSSATLNKQTVGWKSMLMLFALSALEITAAERGVSSISSLRFPGVVGPTRKRRALHRSKSTTTSEEMSFELSEPHFFSEDEDEGEEVISIIRPDPPVGNEQDNPSTVDPPVDDSPPVSGTGQQIEPGPETPGIRPGPDNEIIHPNPGSDNSHSGGQQQPEAGDADSLGQSDGNSGNTGGQTGANPNTGTEQDSDNTDSDSGGSTVNDGSAGQESENLDESITPGEGNESNSEGSQTGDDNNTSNNESMSDTTNDNSNNESESDTTNNTSDNPSNGSQSDTANDNSDSSNNGDESDKTNNASDNSSNGNQSDNANDNSNSSNNGGQSDATNDTSDNSSNGNQSDPAIENSDTPDNESQPDTTTDTSDNSSNGNQSDPAIENSDTPDNESPPDTTTDTSDNSSNMNQSDPAIENSDTPDNQNQPDATTDTSDNSSNVSQSDPATENSNTQNNESQPEAANENSDGSNNESPSDTGRVDNDADNSSNGNQSDNANENSENGGGASNADGTASNGSDNSENGNSDNSENGIGNLVDELPSAVHCRSKTFKEIATLTWTYQLELEPSSDFDTALERMEIQLLYDVAPGLLSCPEPVRRRLATQFGLNAMDHLPADVDLEQPCELALDDPANDCYIVEGQMFLYLEKEDPDLELIYFQIRRRIQRWMSTPINVPDIVKATYLRPELSNPLSAEATPGSIQITSASSALSAQVVVLVSLSSFLLVLVLLAVYRYKNKREYDEGTLTVEPCPDVTHADTQDSDGSSPPVVPLSPFSELLPGAYRLGSDTGMSAILEGDSDSASHARSSDILVSESGYTTEEDSVATEGKGLTYGNLQSLAVAPVLGAQRLVDDDEDDLLFETGSDMASNP